MNITPIKRGRRETRADYSLRVWTGLKKDGLPVAGDLTWDQVQAVAVAYGIQITGGTFNRARLARHIAYNTPKEA